MWRLHIICQLGSLSTAAWRNMEVVPRREKIIEIIEFIE